MALLDKVLGDLDLYIGGFVGRNTSDSISFISPPLESLMAGLVSSRYAGEKRCGRLVSHMCSPS